MFSHSKYLILILPIMAIASSKPHINTLPKENLVEYDNKTDKEDEIISKYIWKDKSHLIEKQLPKLKDPALDKFREVMQIGSQVEKTADERLEEEKLKLQAAKIELELKRLKESESARKQQIKEKEFKEAQITKEKEEYKNSMNKYKYKLKKYLSVAKKLDERFLLPEPTSRMSIGDKIITYANYYTPILSDNKVIDYLEKPIKPENPSDNKSNFFEKSMNTEIKSIKPSNRFSYKLKKIRLSTGDNFGDWFVFKITKNFVEYKHRSTNERIKKYY